MKFTLTTLLFLSFTSLSLASPSPSHSSTHLQRRDELSNFNALVGTWWAALPNTSVIGAVSYEDDSATPLYSDVCFKFENDTGRNINQVFFHLTTYCSTFTDDSCQNYITDEAYEPTGTKELALSNKGELKRRGGNSASCHFRVV